MNNMKKDTKKIKEVNKIKKYKKRKNNISKEKKTLLVTIIVTSVVSFVLCYIILSVLLGKNCFTLYKDMKKVIDTYYTISDNYYNGIDKAKLTEGAIKGIITSVDDNFTDYANKENSSGFNESIDGSYKGIGASIVTYMDGTIEVIDVFKNSPSEKAGLEVKDKILKIDDILLEEEDGKFLSNYVKNGKHDEIKLLVQRGNNEKEIIIKLDHVEIPYVKSKIINKDDKKIGYINISLFGENTYSQFKDNLNNLEKEKIDGLIIDVRNNYGGLLKSVTDISSMFLEKGKVIYSLDSFGKINSFRDKTKEKRDLDIAILINGGSASASEMLTLALRDSYGAKVIGTKSYGKGTVQETRKLRDGSMIKYTVNKWHGPTGECIDKKGITPDVIVEMDDEYYKNLDIKKDNQLNEAINLFLK